VAGRAWIGNAKLLRELRRNESKRMTTDEIIAKSLSNLWHVAPSALAASAVLPMMGVLTYCPSEPGWVVLRVAT